MHEGDGDLIAHKDNETMELSFNNIVHEPKFRYEYTKHKLSVRICGDRRSFYELHELLGECWDSETLPAANNERLI